MTHDEFLDGLARSMDELENETYSLGSLNPVRGAAQRQSMRPLLTSVRAQVEAARTNLDVAYSLAEKWQVRLVEIPVPSNGLDAVHTLTPAAAGLAFFRDGTARAACGTRVPVRAALRAASEAPVCQRCASSGSERGS